MKKYNVEVSASNTIEKEFDTFGEVLDFLENCQGRLSIVDTEKNREIYFGTVENFNRENDAMVRSVNKAAFNR